MFWQWVAATYRAGHRQMHSKQARQCLVAVQRCGSKAAPHSRRRQQHKLGGRDCAPSAIMCAVQSRPSHGNPNCQPGLMMHSSPAAARILQRVTAAAACQACGAVFDVPMAHVDMPMTAHESTCLQTHMLHGPDSGASWCH